MSLIEIESSCNVVTCCRYVVVVVVVVVREASYLVFIVFKNCLSSSQMQ